MSTSSKKITLKSSDEETFEVEVAVALQSETLKYLVEADYADTVIPIPNATSKILAKVIEYCKKHVDDETNNAAFKEQLKYCKKHVEDENNNFVVEEQLKTWDADFVKVDVTTVFDLIKVASFLKIKGLLDLTCQTVADVIRRNSREEIRQYFNIINDFTPEEEEEIRKENQWAFHVGIFVMWANLD